jgi:hypothetical protein
MQNNSLPVPNLYPFADSAEIFNGDAASGAFSRGNDLLRYYVIGVGREPLLFAREFLQAAIRRSGSFLLKFAAQAALTMAYALYFGAAIAFSVGIDGNVSDSEVYPQEVINVSQIGSIGVAGGREVELPSMVDQIRFALPIGEQVLLARPALEFESPTPANRPDRYSLRRDVPRENPVIVGECPMLAKDSLDSLVKFVGVHDLGNTANDHLGGQSKLLASFVVDDLVERRLPEFLRLPCFQADPVACCVSRLQRLLQKRRFFANNDLDFSRQLHYTSIVEQKALKVNRLKAVVSNLAI